MRSRLLLSLNHRCLEFSFLLSEFKPMRYKFISQPEHWYLAYIWEFWAIQIINCVFDNMLMPNKTK